MGDVNAPWAVRRVAYDVTPSGEDTEIIELDDDDPDCDGIEVNDSAGHQVGYFDPTDANLAAIVAAAPDLLAACKAALAFAEGRTIGLTRDNVVIHAQALAHTCRYAIGKAES